VYEFIVDNIVCSESHSEVLVFTFFYISWKLSM